ncbi:MAG TPA: ATP-dependent chaperone ClpB, partial [Acholeplasmatales bacterium]|nr:ATP-dependent chaperone ClpB [Acholeplasmatales bacterium]
FKPEFLNRIDEIVLFHPLSRDTQVKIVEKMLSDLAKRLGAQNVRLAFSAAVKQKIIDEAFDPEYGARPLKRYIQRAIETFVARAIIRSEIVPNVYYTLDVQGEGFGFVRD